MFEKLSSGGTCLVYIRYEVQVYPVDSSPPSSPLLKRTTSAMGAVTSNHHHHGDYRSPTMPLGATLVFLICCSVLSLFIARRMPTTLSEWKRLTWGKLFLVLVLGHSWLFMFLTGFMLMGVGTYQDYWSCSIVLSICLTFGCLLRILISAFLAEMVYMVWSDELCTPRLRSPAFLFCQLSQVGLAGISASLFFGSSAIISDDGTCLFELKTWAIISVPAYSFLQHVFFTFMFCWPLLKSKIKSPALRAVAKMSLWATLLNQSVVFVNVVILLGLGGNEIDWVCMLSCGLDAVFHGLIFYWRSAATPTGVTDHFTLPTISVSATVTFPETNSSARATLGSLKNENATSSTQTVQIPKHGGPASSKATTPTSANTLVDPQLRTWAAPDAIVDPGLSRGRRNSCH
ncbi:hypothetical protein PM082_002361 [Marasmius tenuissimus]|nr:hypothetical protein PM082_002361 [Marasmius tenuissimus]